MKNKKEMMRVIRTPENQVTLDVTGKKNGRGAYLCFSRDCLAKAMKNRGLERSLKIAVGQDVFESLERELDAIESKS
ncbi:MAG: RNase P modulator RnpM [Lachnospiraceae bacterium]